MERQHLRNGKKGISLSDQTEPVPAGERGLDESAEISLGSIRGTATGEADRDVVPGGWGGTEDATSTAPSDMMGISLSPDGRDPEPDINKLGDDVGGFSDLLETDKDQRGPTGRHGPFEKLGPGVW
jgi:hypothetical protein